MAPYPTALRARVVAAVEDGGLAIPEAARIFQVGLTCVKTMLTLPRAGEPLAPRPGGGPVPILQEAAAVLLRQELKARPAAALGELPQVLVTQWHAPVSLATLSRSLHVLNLPRKEKPHRRCTGREGPHGVAQLPKESCASTLRLYC
jgi:transposase